MSKEQVEMVQEEGVEETPIEMETLNTDHEGNKFSFSFQKGSTFQHAKVVLSEFRDYVARLEYDYARKNADAKKEEPKE